MRDRIAKCEQADGSSHLGAMTRRASYHRSLKRRKNRLERRRARLNPECVPGYGRYAGWETWYRIVVL